MKKYTVKFKCWNCYHKWEMKVNQGWLVEEVWCGCWLSEVSGEGWDSIVCPNCKCSEEVRKREK